MVTTAELKTLNRDSVIKVLSHYGAKNITGDNDLRCKCIIHNGSNPTSFCFTVDKGVWCCNSCKRAGNIFELIKEKENTTCFKDTVKKLCDILGINPDDINYTKITDYNSNELQKMYDFINKKDITQNEFDINTLGELIPLKRFRNFDSEFLLSKGAMYSKNLNRLVIPIINDNKTIGATCRRIDNRVNPKWLHKPSGIKTGSILYNFTNLDITKPAVLVEGVFDSWNLELLGVKNAICTFGCSVKDIQANILAKYFLNIDLAYDGDTPGRYGALLAYKKLKKLFNIRFYDFENGQDCGSIKSLDEIKILTFKEFYDKHKEKIEQEGFDVKKILK